ncbi:calcium/manganese antiporter SLC30A10 isoform X1 [Denticeps clupeoides]|uniref:Zinc transporter 10 n=1 Tax=Denticeps clupeoides TaxID=299321 RepID=A0AAY4CZ36_9TELE|nr:zinc transporter 10 isoform X1 [Denticeps clupeoides]
MGRYTGKTCRLIFMLVITVVLFVAEIVAGYVGNSIALVSDAFNMLSDLVSLCVGLAASRLSRRAGSGRATYGLSRAEVVGALANAVFLVGLSISVSMESLKRLARPEPITNPALVLVVGGLGLGANVLGLLIFQDFRRCCGRCRSRSRAGAEDKGGEADASECPAGEEEPKNEGQTLNIRGVLLHVLNDALGSVVVVVAASLFYVWPLEEEAGCNWQCYVDASLTLIMVAIIMSSAAPLLRETIGILMQMSPPDLPLAALLEKVLQLDGVQGVHEAHVWELSRGRVVATLHVRCPPELRGPAFSTLSLRIREIFHYAGVHSLTLQAEFEEPLLWDGVCAAPCLDSSCLSQSCCPAPPSGDPECKANGPLSLPPTEVTVDVQESAKTLLNEKGDAESPLQTTKF